MVTKLVALAVAAVALAASVAAAAYPADAAEPAAGRGLTVTGTHVVRVAPDTAEWSFGVQARASSAGPAMRAASARMRAVVAAVRKAGVARRDIRTEAVSLYPDLSDGGTVQGYVASTTVAAVARSLARSGAIVEAAVEAGAVEVYGPSMTRSDADAQYRAALDAAYVDARAKAERLAAKVGASLGQPTAIVEGATSPPDPYAGRAALSGGGEDAAVEPGRTGIAATVTVTFAIS